MAPSNFEFAFNDSNFSDRMLRVEVMAEPSTIADSAKRNAVDDSVASGSSSCTAEPTIVSVKMLHISSPILAAESPFFYKLFSNGMRESEQRDVILRTTVSEEAALMDMLHFIYTGRLQATSALGLLDVLMVADKYGVSSCIRHCSKLLLNMPMTLDSARLYLEFPASASLTEAMQPLIDAAKKFLESQVENNPFVVIDGDTDININPYPYHRYTDGADAEAHVHAFFITWQANHVSQRLAAADAEISKIAEFGLSLDGQAKKWYLLHDLGHFASFQELRDRFLSFFHRPIPKRVLMGQFYSIYQEPQETVGQFTVRFQNLYHQLGEEIPVDELKDNYLTALRQPLRTAVAFLDFSQQTFNQVIDRVLTMGKGYLQSAVQCTTCLNPGHSTVDCTLQSHCLICRSRGHTLDQCKYNLLNRAAAPVRQIEPCNDCFWDAEQPRYDYDRNEDYEPQYQHKPQTERGPRKNNQFMNNRRPHGNRGTR